jgi:hypothetical protein
MKPVTAVPVSEIIQLKLSDFFLTPFQFVMFLINCLYMHYLKSFKVTRNNVSHLNSSVCNVYTYKPVLEVFRYN